MPDDGVNPLTGFPMRTLLDVQFDPPSSPLT